MTTTHKVLIVKTFTLMIQYIKEKESIGTVRS